MGSTVALPLPVLGALPVDACQPRMPGRWGAVAGSGAGLGLLRVLAVVGAALVWAGGLEARKGAGNGLVWPPAPWVVVASLAFGIECFRLHAKSANT